MDSDLFSLSYSIHWWVGQFNGRSYMIFFVSSLWLQILVIVTFIRGLEGYCKEKKPVLYWLFTPNSPLKSEHVLYQSAYTRFNLLTIYLAISILRMSGLQMPKLNFTNYFVIIN